MKRKPATPSDASELRRRAEAELSERTKQAAPPPTTEADTLRLLQELQVHQIELEMQNEELRRAHEEFEASRARYFDLYDLAPVGYLTLNEQGLVLEANLTAARMLGLARSQLVKKPLTRFIVREDQDVYYLHSRKLFETRARQVGELRMKRKGGAAFWVNIEAIASQGDGDAPLCRATLSDISARKQAEEALQAALTEAVTREHDKAALLQVTRAVLATSTFEEAARRVFEICRQVTGATSGYVAILSEDGQENEVLFLEAGGLPCNVDPSLPMPIRGLRAEAFKSGEVVYDNGFANSEWQRFMPDGHVALRNVMFAPLSLEGKVAGLLGIANKPQDFTAEDVALVGALAEVAAVALQRTHAADALAESEARYRAVVESARDAIVTADSAGNIVGWNRGAEHVFGYTESEVRGQPLTLLMPRRYHDGHLAAMARAQSGGEQHIIGRTAVELEGLRKDKREFPLELSLARSEGSGGWFVTGVIRDITARKQAEKALQQAHNELEVCVQERTAELAIANEALKADITERKRAEEREQSRNQILTSIATGESLATILEGIARSVEADAPEAMCSILFLDKEGQHLLNGAAPSLPDFYNQAIHGLQIGNGVGSCGTAAYTKQRVVVEDILTHPYWAGFRELTQKANLRSCWSQPILSAAGQVLGTFAIYHREPRSPGSEDIERIKSAADFASLAIERTRAEESLRASEIKYRVVADNTYDWEFWLDPEGQFLYASPSCERVTGYTADEFAADADLLDRIIHPDDLPAFAQHRREVTEPPAPGEVEFRVLRRDGAWRWIEHICRPVLDDEGRFRGSRGSNRDITERKRAEERIVQQVARLKSLNTIDAAILSTTDLGLALKTILEEAVSQLGADIGAMMLLDPVTLKLEVAASVGCRVPATARFRVRVGEGIAGKAALERRAIAVPDLAESELSAAANGMAAAEGAQSIYATPLIIKGRVVGVMTILFRAAFHADEDWLDFAETLAGQTAIAIESMRSHERLQRGNVDLLLAYDATIEGWSHALDLRDRETEGHTQRVAEMTIRLARAMGIGEAELVHVRRGALLHDMGKMGVPDHVLFKREPLTDDEWALMRRHPRYAYDMLAPIAYLKPALDIPYGHHEKWDGSGYPRNLRGEQIPLAARLFAPVDIWDALRSDRPYRDAWPEDEVLEHIRSLAGTHLDPEVVELFLRVIDEDAKSAG